MASTPDSISVSGAATSRARPARAPLGRVGSWELVRLAAEGRYARVFQARPAGSAADTSPGNYAAPGYAVKVLNSSWENEPAAVDLFRREALVGRLARHPRLISVLASGVSAPPYYIVTPWLRGATLASRLAERRPAAMTAALWMVRQASEALAALHAVGWMHGDVKPSNIFVSPEGQATLLDFGFARPEEEIRSLADRPVMGTLDYMAPEVFTSPLRTDIRSDIYSLGATLYELLCGEPPFRGSTFAELTRRHREDAPLDIRARVPDLPLAAARLVRSMLAKEPLRRPQTPSELAARLVSLEIATFADRRTA